MKMKKPPTSFYLKKQVLVIVRDEHHAQGRGFPGGGRECRGASDDGGIRYLDHLPAFPPDLKLMQMPQG